MSVGDDDGDGETYLSLDSVVLINMHDSNSDLTMCHTHFMYSCAISRVSILLGDDCYTRDLRFHDRNPQGIWIKFKFD